MDLSIIEGYLKIRLENESLEDILESFDIDPMDVLLDLHSRGFIDEELIR